MLTPGMIIYQVEPELAASEFIDLLVRSTLAARRPVDKSSTIEGMLRHASILITARLTGPVPGVRPTAMPESSRESALEKGRAPEAAVGIVDLVAGRLVGVARAITDFSYCTYLSDLAVDTRVQRCGIGRQLIDSTHRAAGLGTTLILLSAPAAQNYYPRIGMQRHESCWVVPRSES